MEYVAYYWEYYLREFWKPQNGENKVNVSEKKTGKESEFQWSAQEIDVCRERMIVARQVISKRCLQKSSIYHWEPSLTLTNNLLDRCPEIPEQKLLDSQPPTSLTTSEVSGLYKSENIKRSLSSGAFEASETKVKNDMNHTSNPFLELNQPKIIRAIISEVSQRSKVNECVPQDVEPRTTNAIQKDNTEFKIKPQLAHAKNSSVDLNQPAYTETIKAFDKKISLESQYGENTESEKPSHNTSNVPTKKLNNEIKVSSMSGSDQLTQVKSKSTFCSDQLRNFQSYDKSSSGCVSLPKNSTDCENKQLRELYRCAEEGKEAHLSNSSTPLRDIDNEERDSYFRKKQEPEIFKSISVTLGREIPPNCSQAQSKILFPPQEKEAMVATGSSKMVQLANTSGGMKNCNFHLIEVEERLKNQSLAVLETTAITEDALSSNCFRNDVSHSEQNEPSKAHDFSLPHYEKPHKNIAQTLTKQLAQLQENVTSDANRKLMEFQQVIYENKPIPIVRKGGTNTRNSDLEAFHAVESTGVQLSQPSLTSHTPPDLSSSDEESMLSKTNIYRNSSYLNTFSDLSSSDTEPEHQNLTISSNSSFLDTSTDSSSSSDQEPKIQNMTISNNFTARPNSCTASARRSLAKKPHGRASTSSPEPSALDGKLPWNVSVEHNGLKKTDTSSVKLSEFISIEFLDNIFSALQLVELREEIVRCNPWITVEHLVKFRPVHLSKLLLKISKDDLSKLMAWGIYAYSVYFPPSSIQRFNDNWGAHVSPVLENRKWSVRGYLTVDKGENFTKYYMLGEPDNCDENDILNIGVLDITSTDNQGHGSTKSLLPCPKYHRIKSLGRCVHLDDAVIAAETQMLTPQQIAWPQNSELVNTQVLWTAPQMRECKHNFYGNVTFSVSWDAVLERFGPFMYIIGRVTNLRSNMRTRILMTRKSYKSFERVELSTHGSPMIYGENGRMLHAVCCQQGYLNTAGRCHTVQFALECEEGDGEWFYAHSNVMANHHVPTTWDCFKFNVMKNQLCPFRKTPLETRCYLETVVPQLFNKSMVG